MPNEHTGPVRNTYWVKPGKLLAGPYPVPWIESEKARDHLHLLLAAGVTLFLDLTEENEVDGYLLDLLAEAKTRHINAKHYRRPIPDMDVPSKDFMVGILNTIDAALDEGHTVYVHCLGGLGRTGTVVGCYLVRHGMEGQAALDEIVRLREGRTNSPQTPEQHRMVRRWSEP
jgi:protein-tyrosine phosphatase